MINKSALVKTTIVWAVIIAIFTGAYFVPGIVVGILLSGLAVTAIGGLVYVTYCILDDSGYDYYGCNWDDEY